jgi:hypothetical protein
MKDLIIGCIVNYNINHIKYWVNSIQKSGFSGDKIIISFGVDDDTEKYIIEKGFQFYKYERSNRHIVIDRFLAMWQLLNTIDCDYRYIMTTDVRDVIFQYDPSIWLAENMNDKKLLVSSECLKYKHENWGNHNLYNSYPHLYENNSDNIIYNAGTIAGEISYIKDFFLHIFNLSLIGNDPQPDQAAMNILIHTNPFKNCTYKAKQEDGWCCQLGTTLDPRIKDIYAPFLLEPLPNIIGNSVMTSTNKPFCLVHQYDRVPGLNEIIMAKYS